MHVQDTILGLNNYVHDNVMFINVSCLSIYRCTPIFYSNRNSLLAKFIKKNALSRHVERLHGAPWR